MANVGTWMQSIAQDWLVFTLSHSAAAVGVTMALQFLPLLLLGLHTGLVADRPLGCPAGSSSRCPYRGSAGPFGTHDLSYLAFAVMLQINARQHRPR